MKLRLLILAGLAAALGALPALAAPADRSTTVVHRFSDGSTVTGAWSSLVRTDHGASFTVNTSGLTAGDAVTVWWVVFNKPENCTHGELGYRCGAGDLPPFGGDNSADTSVFWATGHVIGGSGQGQFGGYTTTGDPRGQVLFGPGLTNPRGADIHFVVRTHGAAIPSMLPHQIMSFEGACDVNTCEDVQFAVHEPS
jgi:hypothetical protein